jgi:hypothetical protein
VGTGTHVKHQPTTLGQMGHNRGQT